MTTPCFAALAPLPDLARSIAAAEARALTDHITGVCGDRAWSCSHCEADR